VEAVPALTAQVEYVYLFRVVEAALGASPNAKIPTALLPVAAPRYDATVAAVPEVTASLE
jgi:hypothetical protein